MTCLKILCSSQSIHEKSIGIDGHSFHSLSSCIHKEVSWSPFNHDEDNVKIGGSHEGYPGDNTTVSLKGVKNFTENEANTVFPTKIKQNLINFSIKR